MHPHPKLGFWGTPDEKKAGKPDSLPVAVRQVWYQMDRSKAWAVKVLKEKIAEGPEFLLSKFLH